MNLTTNLIRLRKHWLLMLMVLFSWGLVSAQSARTISGTVSSKGETLIGASVVEKGTANGTVTDMDGRFSLNVNPQAELLIRYIGYSDKTVKVGNQSIIQVELTENATLLSEVVAIGYGVQQKKLVTGATLQVKGEDIIKLNTVSALEALQSQAPGVNITKASGKPGDHFKVVIRGLGTVQNSNPLYVIDGLPAGDDDNALSNLNPADIETVDVLKDAASAAIYGSRAANGVILITTKKGRAGKTVIQYDGYMGWQNVYKKATPLNAQQYMDIYNESTGVAADDPTRYERFFRGMTDKDKNDFLAGTWNGTNWLDAMINPNAPITNHALNITGGSESSIFSIGLGYTSQSPLVGVKNDELDPKYERYNVRLNSEHSLIKSGNRNVLLFGQTLQLVYKNSEAITMATNHVNWNDVHNALSANPLYRVYGTESRFATSGWNVLENNPIASMYYNSFSQGQNYAARGSFYLELQPLKNLKYRGSVGYNFSGWKSRSFKPEYTDMAFSASKHEYTEMQQSSDQGMDWNIDNTLSYEFNLREHHHWGIMLGSSFEKTGLGDHVGGRTVNSQFDDFEHTYLNNGVTGGGNETRLTVSGYPWSWRGAMASFFGRINYDYKATYMATVNFRRDGSSKFARGYRWGNFPSVSAGWILSNEAFMEGARSWMNFLKIRTSWGQNGNQAIPAFRYNANIGTIQGRNGYAFGSDKTIATNGTYIANTPNPEITWETSEQWDLGMDAWFAGNRLGVNFDYYQKSTIDWLVQPPSLGTDGTGSPYINGGKVRNEGVELFLTWQEQRNKDFKYSVTANLAYNKNKVIDIPNEQKRIEGASSVLGEQTDPMYRAEVGYPIGYFYGYKADGIIRTQEEAEAYDETHKIYISNVLVASKPGDVKYVDVSEDGIIDAKDKTMIGNPHPDVTFGLSAGLGWKGFDLGISANGVAGNQIAKSYRSFATQTSNNYTTEILDRWTEQNPSSNIPRLGEGSTERNWLKISDLVFIENGDFLRINNVTLGYDFMHLFKKSPVLSQLRVYAQVQNLVTFTKYSGMDPDIGADGSSSSVSWAKGIDVGFYPSARTYLFGVSIKY